MIKHYSKESIPLQKIKYKKEDGKETLIYSESVTAVAIKHAAFIDEMICDAAAKEAFNQGFDEVFLLDSEEIKQALLEYWQRKQHVTAERKLGIIPVHAKFSIKNGFCTPDRVNYTAVRCMTEELLKHVKVKMIDNAGDYSVFEAELDVVR